MDIFEEILIPRSRVGLVLKRFAFLNLRAFYRIKKFKFISNVQLQNLVLRLRLACVGVGAT
jgi:hypothetical protein